MSFLDHTLPLRETKQFWPESLIDMMVAVGVIKVGIEGRKFIITEYKEGDAMGPELMEIFVKEAEITQNGGCI